VSFAATTPCVATQLMFVVYFVIDYRLNPETFGYTLVCKDISIFCEHNPCMLLNTEVLAFLLCIRKITGSNLGPGIRYLD